MVVIRKHGARNAALAGLASGISQGIALGQRTRALQQQQDRDQFEEQQALRHAALVDRQMQQEQADRGAVGDAAASMVGDPMQGAPPSPGAAGAAIGAGVGGMGAGAGAMLGAQDAQAIGRVQAIAKRLPPQYAMPFVKAASEKHAEIVDERDRKALTNKIANWTADGSGFTLQPDGTKIQDKKTDESSKQLTDLIAKKAPIEAINQAFLDLRNAQAGAESRYRRRQSYATWIDQQAASLDQNQSQGIPQDPSEVMARHEQAADLHKLASWWTQFQDDIEGHPLGMQKMTQAVLDAARGYTYVGGKRVKYTEKAKEQELQAEKQKTEQLRQALIQAQTEREKLQPANDAKKADAAMQNATRPRGPASGTVSRPLSQAEALNRAMEIQKANGGDTSPTRLKFIARQLMQGDEETAPTGAPTPEATNAANAGQTSRAAAISPESAVKAGWTTEEFDAYVDHGTVPKGKPIK